MLVIAPNLNRRWSGVTSTIFGLLPVQAKQINIVAFGYNIPKEIRDCNLDPGTVVTIKYGEGLAWATIANP